jgi:hypothetical protein
LHIYSDKVLDKFTITKENKRWFDWSIERYTKAR